MGYEHIIAARQRLQQLGVPHLDIGGAIGGAGLGTLVMGPMGALPGAAMGSSGSGIAGGITQGIGGALQRATPTNHYQAQTPGITTQNWQPGMAYGQGAVGEGIDDLQSTQGAQRSLAGTQLGTSAGIGTEAGAVSGLAGPQGLGGVLGQQQSLGQALLAQSQGQGPNPAQEQYKQNVDRAISQNAGMIASSKGINPALAARMASDNAASMTQGAAGNAATLQAEQQLAAEGQLGGVLRDQGNTVMGQGQLHSTAGGLLGTQVGAQGAAGTTLAQAGASGNDIASQGNQFYGTNVSGQGGQNNAVNTGTLGTEGINAGVASGNTQIKGQILGGLLNGAGGVAAAALAHGGVAGVDGKAMSLAQTLMAQGGTVPGTAKVPGDSPKNDVVPTVLSPGEIVIPRTQAEDPEKAARFVAALKERDAGKEPEGYGHVLKKVRALRGQMAELEKSLGRAS